MASAHFAVVEQRRDEIDSGLDRDDVVRQQRQIEPQPRKVVRSLLATAQDFTGVANP